MNMCDTYMPPFEQEKRMKRNNARKIGRVENGTWKTRNCDKNISLIIMV
jgi:hypothetical protein